MSVHSHLKMDRKALIVTTARKIIVQNGLFDAAVGKIAKAAGIPVGSVYTYFESKEALINEIFREAKQEMGAYIFQPIVPEVSEKKALNIYWERAVDFGLANQEKFFFAEQFANSPLIQSSTQAEIKTQFAPVFRLLENGISKGLLKPMDVFVMHNIVYTNIVGTIKYFAQFDTEILQELKNQLFECCWDSIAHTSPTS